MNTQTKAKEITEAQCLEQIEFIERVKANGVIPEAQQKLAFLLEGIEGKSKTPEEGTYETVLRMVYTLLIDGRLDDLNTMITIGFPEYYALPADDNTKLEWGGKLYALKEAIDNGTIANTLFK